MKRFFSLLIVCCLLGAGCAWAEENTQAGEFDMEALQQLLELMAYRYDHYYELAEPEQPIEAVYTPLGSCAIAYAEYEVPEETYQKIEIWYPEGLTEDVYPAVIMVNGTGVLASQYQAVFRHLASWGFIAVGNEEPSTGTGESTEKTWQFIKALNENADCVFYGKFDMDNIGLCGHSQGGAGVFSALTLTEHADAYKTAVALSPTHEETAALLGWPYQLEKVNTPVLMVAGTKGDFETQLVIPFEKMTAMYEKIPAPKAMMRRAGSEHGDMLYDADAYVTAWMMWQLKGEEQAARVFTGEAPELLINSHYQDQRIDLK